MRAFCLVADNRQLRTFLPFSQLNLVAPCSESQQAPMRFFLLSAVSLAAVLSAPAGVLEDPVRHQEECDAGVVRDCVVSTGWTWSACSAQCGEGTITRTRTVIHLQCNGGTACPIMSQTRQCMNVVCDCAKVHCAYEASFLIRTPYHNSTNQRFSEPHVFELRGRRRRHVPLQRLALRPPVTVVRSNAACQREPLHSPEGQRQRPLEPIRPTQQLPPIIRHRRQARHTASR
jgi:hypothetical protein